MVIASHSWEEPDDYEIRAIAKDINGVQSEWSEPAIIVIVENEKPTRVEINGPTWGFGGEEYEFTFSSSDAEGSDIYYRVDWDDGDDTGFIGPYSSGETITLSHKWKTKGTYWIKAWAKDTMGGESNQASQKMNILTSSAKSLQSNPLFSQLFFGYLKEVVIELERLAQRAVNALIPLDNERYQRLPTKKPPCVLKASSWKKGGKRWQTDEPRYLGDHAV